MSTYATCQRVSFVFYVDGNEHRWRDLLDHFIRYTLFPTNKITLIFSIKYSNLIANYYTFQQFYNHNMILCNPRPKKRGLFIFSRNKTPLRIHLFSTELGRFTFASDYSIVKLQHKCFTVQTMRPMIIFYSLCIFSW